VNHPTTYHGQLAALEIGDRPRQPPPADIPNAQEEQIYRNHELVRVVRMLDEIGQRKRVRTFILRLSEIAKGQKERILAARLARSIGRPDLGVWLSRRAQRAGIVLIKHGYPLVPVPDGFPERALLMAVARQESNFDASATSHAGARGMIQLKPATAHGVARGLKIRYSHSRPTTYGSGAAISKRCSPLIKFLHPRHRQLQRWSAYHKEMDPPKWRPAGVRHRPDRLDRTDTVQQNAELCSACIRQFTGLSASLAAGQSRRHTKARSSTIKPNFRNWNLPYEGRALPGNQGLRI